MPLPPALGEIFAALSVFLLYVRSDTGGDGGGESTLTGDGPGPAVESSPPSTELAPVPTADIASTAAAAEQGEADANRFDLITCTNNAGNPRYGWRGSGTASKSTKNKWGLKESQCDWVVALMQIDRQERTIGGRAERNAKD